MTSRPKTHFVMDDRGLGGTYMIQQQFLDMYRKIHQASKMVDDDAPRTTVIRRPTFSQFGEYYNRVRPSPINRRAKAVVDSSAPESYSLIANLYINQGARAEGAREKRRFKKQPVPIGAHVSGEDTPNTPHRPLSGAAATSSTSVRSRGRGSVSYHQSPSGVSSVNRRDQTAVSDIRSRLDTYIEESDLRKKAINEELVQLQKRRLLRIRGVLPLNSSTQEVAKAMLETLDGPHHKVESSSEGRPSPVVGRNKSSTSIDDDGCCEEGEALTPPRGYTATPPPSRPVAAATVIAPTPPKTKDPAAAPRHGGPSAGPEFGPPLSQLVLKKKDVWSNTQSSTLGAASHPHAPPTAGFERGKSTHSESKSVSRGSSPQPRRYQHYSPSGTAASSPGSCCNSCGVVPLGAAALITPYDDDEVW